MNINCIYDWRYATPIKMIVLIVSLAVAGCQKPAALPATASGPWIKAEPNPVSIPMGADKGNTRISWNTVDGSKAQVYLREPGKPDKLFSGGSHHSEEINWIKKGGRHEFILFAGSDHTTELARVVVTGE